MSGSASPYPHYVGNAHSYTVHLIMVHCKMWYCARSGMEAFNGGAADPATGWQWVLGFASNADFASSVTGTNYQSYIAMTTSSMVNPMDLFSAGVPWVKSKGGSVPTEFLIPSLSGRLPVANFGPLSYLSTSVGQHAGHAVYGSHASLGWLAAKLDAPGSGGNLSLGLKGCDVAMCTSGYYSVNSSGTAEHCAASETHCVACPNGTTSIAGYQGATACFWDAPVLRVTFTPSNDRSGDYVKSSDGLHGERPYYTRITNNGYGGFVLRHDRFGGWVITVLPNMNDGSGYMGDLRRPASCGCGVSEAPYPHLVAAMPCQGCTEASEWCESDGSTCFATTIAPVGSPPLDESGGTNGNEICSCSTHSFAGSAEYCASYDATEARSCSHVSPPVAPPPSAPPPPPPSSPPPISPPPPVSPPVSPPTPSPPPPSPPAFPPGANVAVQHQAVVSLVAAGSIEEYTDEVKRAIGESAAAAANLPPEAATVTVEPASVRLRIVLVAPTSQGASDASAALSASLSSPEAATAVLGVDVQATPVIETLTVAQRADTEEDGTAAGLSLGAIVAAVCVAVLLVGAAGGYWWWTRTRGGDLEAEVVSRVSPAVAVSSSAASSPKMAEPDVPSGTV